MRPDGQPGGTSTRLIKAEWARAAIATPKPAAKPTFTRCSVDDVAATAKGKTASGPADSRQTLRASRQECSLDGAANGLRLRAAPGGLFRHPTARLTNGCAAGGVRSDGACLAQGRPADDGGPGAAAGGAGREFSHQSGGARRVGCGRAKAAISCLALGKRGPKACARLCSPARAQPHAAPHCRPHFSATSALARALHRRRNHVSRCAY